MKTQSSEIIYPIIPVKMYLPNPVTPTTDTAFESVEMFLLFLQEIEVLQERPWAANWIRTYWTDNLISEYGEDGYDGLFDFEILEHMGEWLDSKIHSEVQIFN